jgi:peptide deformylase
MALRKIITWPDLILQKRCREVTDFGPRLHQLLDDMKETLIETGGAGLAAPQVGTLRRVALVLEMNVAEDEEEYFIEIINPEIIESDGEQCGPEGCLSVPGEFGLVTRPHSVRIRAQDRNGKPFEVEGEGITARAFCHEIDHLNGIIFTSLAERMLDEDELIQQEGED